MTVAKKDTRRTKKRRTIRIPKWLTKEEVEALQAEIIHNPHLTDEEALQRVLFNTTRLEEIYAERIQPESEDEDEEEPEDE